MKCLGCGHEIHQHQSHGNRKQCIDYLNGLIDKIGFQQHYKKENDDKIASLETEIVGLHSAASIQDNIITGHLKTIRVLQEEVKVKEGVISSMKLDKETWRKKINELEKEADSLNEELRLLKLSSNK